MRGKRSFSHLGNQRCLPRSAPWRPVDHHFLSTRTMCANSLAPGLRCTLIGGKARPDGYPIIYIACRKGLLGNACLEGFNQSRVLAVTPTSMLRGHQV